MTAISVIVSTYNRPDFLDLVLRGYFRQSDREFEIVIADDGSSDATAAVIEKARGETGMPVRHVWHEDRGFRKSLILNRAITAASGDYLIFTDGDCSPRRDLISVHRRLSRPGCFVAGGYLKLPAEVSRSIRRADVESGDVTNLRWLESKGWRPGRRRLRLVRSPRLAALFDLVTPTSAEFQGNNASTWRDALVAVNGFESGMGYGGLDKALGYRLRNAGVRGIQARHRAIAVHLHHDRPYRDAETVSRNRETMRRLKNDRGVRAASGLAELGPDPSLRIDGQPVFATSEGRV
jgi:glycosyltransferase involved in cell wall biosynthesis